MTKEEFRKYLWSQLELLYNASDPCDVFKHHGIIDIKLVGEQVPATEKDQAWCYWFNTLDDTIDFIKPGRTYRIRFGIGDRHYIVDEKSRAHVMLKDGKYSIE